jgi:hypothetical protein
MVHLRPLATLFWLSRVRTRTLLKNETYFYSPKNQKPPKVNKEHPWRLLHLLEYPSHIKLQKVWDIFGGKWASNAILDQNLHPLNRPVNMNLAGDFCREQESDFYHFSSFSCDDAQ